ncbi:hypothetical protein LTR96_011341 [Exophiala xenobiotica]|nr:hypothetical protein LTR92_011567 [Exophiala xenobiotica]KAK5263243.1 hypothetical protein LTR96_011341 [Exophiala xenobiotica]KAK5332511.1 hypothetical protein LTR98_011363 [Exophiala xenobiotica]
MMRNPYNGASDTGIWDFLCQGLASRGYTVINQSVRGTHKSEGEFVPFRQEQNDGYDAVESLITGLPKALFRSKVFHTPNFAIECGLGRGNMFSRAKMNRRKIRYPCQLPAPNANRTIPYGPKWGPEPAVIGRSTQPSTLEHDIAQILVVSLHVAEISTNTSTLHYSPANG